MSGSKSIIPMLSNRGATAAGILPILDEPVRFAVGDPNGVTSNSWRVWAEKNDELYIACRDSFTETKVSLHASGRWRMGFTTQAIAKNPNLMPENGNRAWEVWDRPNETLPKTITAFHLYFVTSELAVTQEQRVGKKWKGVHFIEAGPVGKITTVTLFITRGDCDPVHESEPSFVLASFGLTDGRYAKIVAHGDPYGFLPELIEASVSEAWRALAEKDIAVPATAFSYFFGHRENGARFIVGARMRRNGPIG
jgi:hypothetical protein